MNHLKKLKQNTYIIFTLLSCAVLIFVFFNILIEPKFFSKDPRELISPYEFKGTVDITMQDGEHFTTTVPFSLETDQAFDVTLNLQDIGMIDDKTLSFISKDVLIRCEVDDKIIFRSASVHTDSSFDDANSMYLVDLPKTVDKNIVTLHYYNDKDYLTTFELKNVTIGKRINIISYYFIKDNFLNSIIIILLLIIFVSIILAGNFFKKNISNIARYFNYIAFFVLLLDVYVISTSPLNYFILYKYKVILHLLSYTTVMLVPIVIMKAVMYRTDYKTHKYLKFGIIIGSVNIIVQYLCTYLGYNNLNMMVSYTYIVALYSIIAITYAIVKTKNTKENKVKLMFPSLLPLLITISIEIIYNYIYGVIVFTTYFKIGLIIYSILQFKEFLSIYIAYRDERVETDVYKRLALIDNLTGMGNRMAFSEKRELYTKENSAFYLIVMDVDNLKYVNDTYGHKYGDEIIKLLPKVIIEILGENNQVDVYRAGGDEFFVIYHTNKNEGIEELLMQIRSKYESHNKADSAKKYSVSYGYSYYDFQNGDNFDEILHIADQNMYKNKSTKKTRRSDV